MMNVTKLFVMGSLMVGLLMLANCKFEEIDQPETATAGEQIEVFLTLSTSDSDANAKYGILAMLLPVDWTVDGVNYDGDFGQGTTHFLHPDSADSYPSNQDFWADSLELYFPTEENMHWVVYESDEAYSWAEVSYIDVVIDMTVGNTNGSYDLGYLWTEASLELNDPEYYADSLGHTITVTGGTGVTEEIPVVNEFNLSQNYPNPFNPETNIEFTLAEKSFVTLTVYDLLGNPISILVNNIREAGIHKTKFNGSHLPSGIYLYKLQVGEMAKTLKMVLSK